MATGDRDTAGVIAPPPLIYLACILLGVGLDWLWPAPFATGWAGGLVGGGLIVLGLATITIAFMRFRSAGTDVRPHKPTTALVTGGLFHLSRNPMYTGFAVVQLGLAVALNNIWILAALVPALLLIRFGVIAREERYLEAKFGQDYLDYKTRFRRWI